MPPSHPHRLALIASLIALNLPPVQAAGTELEQVLVTGTRKLDRSLAQSESPVDVISAAELQRSGSNELATALAQLLPALNFPRPSLTDASDAVRPAQLRGLSPDQTLVLIDGKRRHSGAVVNINGSQGRGSAPVDLNSIPIVAVERVEVLRDGAAAQYGSDAIAGVINIVLRKGAQGGQAGLELGGTDRGDGQRQALAASLGGSLGGTQGWWRLSAESRHQDPSNRAGVDSRDAASEPRRGQVNNRLGDPRSTQHALLLNAELALTPELKSYAQLGLSQRDTLSAAFWRTRATALANNVASLYPEGFLPLQDSRSRDQSALLGLRGRLQAWQWDLSLAHGRNDFEIAVENTANYSLGANSPTRFEAGRLRNEQNLLNLDLSRELDAGLAAPLTLAAGAEFRQERYGIAAGEPGSYSGGGASGFPGFQPANAGRHSRHSSALYAGVEAQISRDSSASAALRVEDYSDFGRASALKLSGRHALSAGLALRATLSSGFRAPSLAQQFFATTSTNLINGALVEAGTFPVNSGAAQALGARSLKAETSRQASLGLQWQASRDWQTSLDLYQIDIDDRVLLSANLSLPASLRSALAAQGVLVSAGRYFTNALDTRSRGLDLVSTLTQRWSTGLRGDYTLAYNHSHNSIRRVADNPALLSANNLELIDRVTLARATISSPRSKLVFSAGHAWGPWQLRLAATRYGGYEVRQSNPLNDQRFSAAWLLDASLGWSQGAWNAQLGVDNLGNRYPDEVLAANAVGGILRYSSFSPFGFNGRQYAAKLGYRW